MKDGTASHTARSVAAHRLEYERVAADYGDPAADQALTADVADGQQPNPGRMHEHLRARTAFFDRLVVNALGRGVRQVVIGGAGDDGRALRYAKPGVTWFELDHPATQADKVARVTRLGLERGQVRFIAADFTANPIAEPLLAAGLDPASPTLFLLEGVAVYLERPVLERVLAAFRQVAADGSERVLAAFRQVAADGSELAMSGSTGTATPQQRARFQQRVADLGEPIRSQFTPDQARDLLAAVGWQPTEGAERQLAAACCWPGPAIPERPASRRPRSTVPRPPFPYRPCCRRRFGVAVIDDLRAALADVVARPDPALPDCLPILGYALRAAFEPEAPTARQETPDQEDVTHLPLSAGWPRAGWRPRAPTPAAAGSRSPASPPRGAPPALPTPPGPPRVLPHYPMTLHRGGYPGGA